MDAESLEQPLLLWLPSCNPDLCERRLWDRLSRFSPAVCRTEQQALDAVRKHGTTVAFANGPAKGWDAAALLTALQADCPGFSFFLRDIRLPISKAVQLARAGAAGIFGEDADEAAIAGEIESAIERCAAREPSWRAGLIGSSESMAEICSMAQLVSDRRGTVLLTGETGSGKEVVARAIHAAGNRARYPFVAVNCSAIPGTLLESELFGHVRGAFTGASMPRVGRFEQAQHGTLFLDEIGDLELELQTKLLRVLQERELQRLGSSEIVRLDVRVIAATHVDLNARINEGAFRADLFYRLNVIPITVPPLRARIGDIPLLTEHILRKICSTEKIAVRGLTGGALMALMEYSWPGNIRELENILERAVALSGSRIVLTENDFHLPPTSSVFDAADAATTAHGAPIDATRAACQVPDGGFDYEGAVSRFEWTLLSRALRKANGNKKAAADLLGLKRTTLAAKVKVLAPGPGNVVM